MTVSTSGVVARRLATTLSAALLTAAALSVGVTDAFASTPDSHASEQGTTQSSEHAAQPAQQDDSAAAQDDSTATQDDSTAANDSSTTDSTEDNTTASDHQTEGTAGTSGNPDEAQPTSTADDNPGGANNGGDCGAYCSTRPEGPSDNGVGDGQATGEPCAGCVGKADNKNPPGQRPDASDGNQGYECDGNQGIARTNPAHTSCTTTTTSLTPTDVCDETTPCNECIPTVQNHFCSSVEGETILGGTVTTPTPTTTTTTTNRPPTVLGERITRTPRSTPPTVLPNSRSTLPFTGAQTAALLTSAGILLGLGSLLVLSGRRRKVSTTV